MTFDGCCPICGSEPLAKQPQPGLHAFSTIYICGRHEIWAIDPNVKEPYIEKECPLKGKTNETPNV